MEETKLISLAKEHLWDMMSNLAQRVYTLVKFKFKVPQTDYLILLMIATWQLVSNFIMIKTMFFHFQKHAVSSTLIHQLGSSLILCHKRQSITTKEYFVLCETIKF